MFVPSVVQTDSDYFRVGNDDKSSISPSELASFDVNTDSAEVPPPNLSSVREWYVSQSNSKRGLFAMAVTDAIDTLNVETATKARKSCY